MFWHVIFHLLHAIHSWQHTHTRHCYIYVLSNFHSFIDTFDHLLLLINNKTKKRQNLALNVSNDCLKASKARAICWLRTLSLMLQRYTSLTSEKHHDTAMNRKKLTIFIWQQTNGNVNYSKCAKERSRRQRSPVFIFWQINLRSREQKIYWCLFSCRCLYVLVPHVVPAHINWSVKGLW